jgi:hypothetical protein
VGAVRVDIMNGRPQGGRALDFGGADDQAAPTAPVAPPAADADRVATPPAAAFSTRPFWAARRNQSRLPRCGLAHGRPRVRRDAGDGRRYRSALWIR